VNRLWTNLSQILRSLPNDIKRSAEDFEEIRDFADDMATFIDLGTDDRKKCLAVLKGKEK